MVQGTSDENSFCSDGGDCSGRSRALRMRDREVGPDARRDYERSVADYENCLAANQMSTCEGERRIMKANKKVLSATVQRLGR